MNKIFKKIWNRARGCFVAVSEVANSASQKSSNITVQGYSFLSVGKGFMHTAKVFRLSAVAACLMPILGTWIFLIISAGFSQISVSVL